VKGDDLVVEGRLVRRGSTIGFVDVDVKDDQGALVARGVGPFMIFRDQEGNPRE